MSAEIVRLVSYWEISYLFGATGFNKDHKKKLLSYFNIACNGGLTRSMLKISDFMYELGKGAQRDIVKGMAYYRRACDKGYFSGCYSFASYHYNYGDKGKAAEYLKKACDLGRDDYSIQNYPEYKTDGKNLAICMIS